MTTAPLPLTDATLATSIANLITEFCWRVDGGEGHRVAELFTDDATLATPAFTLSGRQEIHDWFSVRADPTKRLSRHFWTNLRIVATGDDRYTVQAYAMTVVGVPPAPAAGADVVLGVSTDIVLVRDGQPLFVSRALDISFQGRLVEKAAA